MKAKLEIKRQPLPNYQCEGLCKSIRQSARAHGYRSSLWYAAVRWKDHVLNQWAMRSAWNGLRVRFQRWRGVNIGRNVHIGPGCTLDYAYPYFISIGDNASLAGNVYVLAHSNPMECHSKCAESFVAPTVIGANAWIGVNTTIMPGVTIGEGAIVATGAVVNHDVAPWTMVAGNPARSVKTIEH